MISLQTMAWMLRLLALVAIGLLCWIARSLDPAVAFAVTWVPNILFVIAVLGGIIQFPRFLAAVHPMEPVLYQWMGVGLIKRIVATRIWPVLVGVVPPPKPARRRDFLDYTERSTQGAELSHWPTLLVALAIAIVCLLGGRIAIASWILAFNMMFNAYPIMLQRSNRWRVHQLRADMA